VCAAIFFFEAALGPYFDNLNDMIVKRFNIEYTMAGKLLLLPEGLLVFFGYALSKICYETPKWRRKIMLGITLAYFFAISLVYLLPNTDEPGFLHYLVIIVFLLCMSIMFAC
jgi:peptidoglycan/LPS O-acetylase OafA/YrhL